jgi:tetratricopeptide (TPR) repeat protein
VSVLSLSPDEIVAALRGADPQAVLASLLRADPRRGVLRALAVPLAFDQGLYEILVPKNSPPFDSVIRWPEVEPIFGREGHYRVVEREEKVAWWKAASSAFGSVPPALAVAAKRAAEYVSKNGEDVELLTLLLFFDKSRALKLFESLYRQADASFDLASCHQLLGVVAGALDFVPTAIRETWDRYRAYFEARTQFSDEFHRSRMYVSRDNVTKAFNRLLGKPKKWMLNLHATGGMGKTAAIRWLIAHRCVGKRIPVARIDLDFTEIFQLTDTPRLIHMLASELNRQIPQEPFSELLIDLQSYVGAATARVFNREIEGYEKELVGRFGKILSESRGADAPVVLIFDTIENGLLYNLDEFEKVVSILAAIRGEAPGIRVVLAGRYPLLEWIEASQEYEKFCDVVRVDEMSGDEAETYLIEKRGVADERTVKLVVRNAGGVPLKLALYADIIRTTPGLTAKDIESYGRSGADVIYLIERVIDRLREPELQWILRYGSVPRQLTLPFVEIVMQPYLREEMAKGTAADDPEKNLPQRSTGHAFPRNVIASVDAPIDFPALWTRLRRYASEQSWVFPDRDRKDTLRFRSDVVNPMRRLLAENSVFVKLHRAAIRYYEKQAKKSSGLEWAALICEAIYHRFQIGQNGRSAWRKAVAAAIRTGEAEVIRAVAAEITRPEYVDEQQPLVTGASIAEARGVEAAVLVRMAREGKQAAWNEAGIAVSRGEAAIRGRAPANANLRIAKAADLAQKGAAERALRVLRATRATGPTELSRLLLLAEIYASRGQERATGTFRAAYAVARRVGFFRSGSVRTVILDRDSSTVEPTIVFAIAWAARRSGDFEEAIAIIGSLLRVARRRTSQTVANACRIEIASYFLATLQPHAATAALLPLPESPERSHLRAEALRLSYALREALMHCDRGEALIDESGSDRGRVLMAALLAVKMRIYSEQMELDLFRETCEQALGYARHTEDASLLVHILTLRADAEMRVGGREGTLHVKDLIGHLERAARRSTLPSDSMKALLVRARHESALRRGAQSVRKAWALTTNLTDETTVAATGATIGTAREWFPLLAARLHKVRPLAARLALLEPLRGVLPAVIDPAVVRRLHDVLKGPLTGIRGPDRSILDLRRAEIFANLGLYAEAARVITAMRARLDVDQMPTFLREFAAVAEKAGVWRLSDARSLYRLVRRNRRVPEPLRAMMLAEEAVRQADSDPAFARRLVAEVNVGTSKGTIFEHVGRLLAMARRGIDPKEAFDPRKALRAGRPDVLSIQIDRRGEGAGVIVSIGGLGVSGGRRPSPWSAVGVHAKGRAGAVVEHGFVDVFRQHARRAIDQMGAFLFRHMPRQVSDGKVDLSLMITETSWHALPWEMVAQSSASPFIPRRRLRSVFRTAPISIPIMRTVNISKALFIVSGSFSKTRSVLIQPEVYGRVNPQYVTPQRMSVAIAEADFDVLHIISRFAEDTNTGRIYLDFGDGPTRSSLVRSERSTREVTAETLALMLARNHRRHASLVVLDTIRPSSPSEAIRQMMLRNVFAAELFNTGKAMVVIATGLWRPGEDVRAYALAGHSLKSGVRAIDLFKEEQALSKPSVPNGDRAVGIWTTATFAVSPETELTA